MSGTIDIADRLPPRDADAIMDLAICKLGECVSAGDVEAASEWCDLISRLEAWIGGAGLMGGL